ncbi:hypothetical protein SKAU_G00015700 [Synaphobranchus kaupii]|uniref:Uncharacterized protein n=1 Tax=Synaphobranchus kaupii TaxID=118154 RepID=A0A9Q1GCN5_SYNKA|nr:hypothetical protein SKAU_G00015700 [Synaphobranchus kaupii]
MILRHVNASSTANLTTTTAEKPTIPQASLQARVRLRTTLTSSGSGQQADDRPLHPRSARNARQPQPLHAARSLLPRATCRLQITGALTGAEQEHLRPPASLSLPIHSPPGRESVSHASAETLMNDEETRQSSKSRSRLLIETVKPQRRCGAP